MNISYLKNLIPSHHRPSANYFCAGLCRWFLVLSAWSFVLLSGPAKAITINLSDPNPTYFATQSPCLPHSACESYAHLSTAAISFIDNVYFDDAFNAWNAGLQAGDNWTLVDGGAIDATLNVSTFDALSLHGSGNPGFGGLVIRAELVYNGADRDDLVWSQGLFLNYDPPGTNNINAFSTMDDNAFSNLACNPNAAKSTTRSPGIWCGPVYPYQYTDEHFFDRPMAPYDKGFFEADALLTKVDYTNRVLTVFEGLHYGFNLSVQEPSTALLVPEPSTGLLMLLGLSAMTVMRRKWLI